MSSAALTEKYIPRAPQFMRSSEQIPMGNGRYRVCLIAGATRDWARALRMKLAKRGIYAKYHFDLEKHHQWDREIPRDVDLVIILKDAVLHSLEDKVVTSCRAANVRWVRTQRNGSKMMAALYQHHILGDPLPTEHVSTMVFDDDLDVTPVVKPDVRPTPVLTLANAQPILTPEPMPAIQLNVQQTPVPVEVPAARPGSPSTQLAAVASVLWRLCQDEGVQLLLTPRSMTFEPVT